jgi:hypothetical protein
MDKEATTVDSIVLLNGAQAFWDIKEAGFCLILLKEKRKTDSILKLHKQWYCVP